MKKRIGTTVVFYISFITNIGLVCMMTLDSAAVPTAKHPARDNRITIDNVFYVLRIAEGPASAILNMLARKRYGNYRDASTIINRLVHCGMIIERIVRDERQKPRVSCAITEKCKAALRVFEG